MPPIPPHLRKPVPGPRPAPPDGKPRCPHCDETSCYHCWECAASLDREGHYEGCLNQEVRRVGCPACGNTGKNSRGGPCHPCVQRGRIKGY